jgi:hypothetical protein
MKRRNVITKLFSLPAAAAVLATGASLKGAKPLGKRHTLAPDEAEILAEVLHSPDNPRRDEISVAYVVSLLLASEIARRELGADAPKETFETRRAEIARDRYGVILEVTR